MAHAEQDAHALRAQLKSKGLPEAAAKVCQ